MANTPYQFPPPPHPSPRQGLDDARVGVGMNNPGYGGGDVQGAFDRHDSPQGYGPDGYPQGFGAGWITIPFYPLTTQTSDTMHARARSENLHATNQGVLEYNDLHNRRSSVPSNAYTPQRPFGYHPGSHTSQGLPLMTRGQHQPQTQPTMSGPPSASPSHTPWYTPSSSPHPDPQLDPNFAFDTPFFPQIDQVALTIPGVGRSRGGKDRSPNSSPRIHPYQYRDTRRPSWTRGGIGNTHFVGSPGDPSLVASSSQTRLDDPESATSPGADSDYTLSSFPNTPADTTGAMSEGLDEDTLKARRLDRKKERQEVKKEKQRVKKKDDRKREGDNLVRVKTLLGMPDSKKIDVLETIVKFLGGDVPNLLGQPTAALPGRTRKPRATQVAASRADARLVFEAIGKCMGYTTKVAPKREVLLKEVADEIEKRIAGTQPPGPQGGGGQGGHYMTQ